MSVELLSVLIAVVAVGAALAGLILTGQRAIRAELADQRRGFSAELAGNVNTLTSGSPPWSSKSPSCASAWPTSKDCWTAYARPSPSDREPPNPTKKIPSLEGWPKAGVGSSQIEVLEYRGQLGVALTEGA